MAADFKKFEDDDEDLLAEDALEDEDEEEEDEEEEHAMRHSRLTDVAEWENDFSYGTDDLDDVRSSIESSTGYSRSYLDEE
ncbi:MAG: hypothetical protein PHN64_08960 [Desulfovibrionaceae bacterium]|jgi:hypothetical protein|nr:hypothetical protein [Desulfovibrionaceae bacterium]